MPATALSLRTLFPRSAQHAVSKAVTARRKLGGWTERVMDVWCLEHMMAGHQPKVALRNSRLPKMTRACIELAEVDPVTLPLNAARASQMPHGAQMAMYAGCPLVLDIVCTVTASTLKSTDSLLSTPGSQGVLRQSQVRPQLILTI